MKKRVALLTFLMIVSVSLTACASGTGGLSEAELDQVAEYAAKTILKHTKGYEATLLEELSIKENPSLNKEEFEVAGKTATTTAVNTQEEKTPEKTPDKAESDNEEGNTTDPAINDVKDDDNVVKALNDIYGVSGFEVVYGGSGVYERYPKNEGYFSLVAGKDMKLYVIEFSIRNKGDKNKKFSQGEGINYGLTFNGESFYKPSLTLLENDIQSIDVSVAGGKSAKGVLVFNISSKEDKNKAKLRITNKNSSYTLTVTQ